MNAESQACGELSRSAPEPTGLIPAAPAARVATVSRAGPLSPSQAQASVASPLSLLRALRRRSALALGVALLTAGIAGPAAWYVLPLSFRAQASLQVIAQTPKVLFTTVETQNTGGGDDYKRYQSTQQTLVKSQLVLNAALRDSKVAKYRMIAEHVDPIEWLQEKLRVDFVAGSEVMEISLSGGDPV